MDKFEQSPYAVLHDVRLWRNDAVYKAATERGLHEQLVKGLRQQVRNEI